jgi:hypothetical protein
MKNNNPFTRVAFRVIPALLLVIAAGVSSTGITSCNESVDHDSTAAVNGNTASKEDLLKIIQGGWVNVEYGNVLNRVHSPMFAAEAGRPVQEMLFETGNAKGDTVYNSTGRLNYLDGERFDVVFAQENGSVRMKIYEGETALEADSVYLDYRIADGDTLLCVVNARTKDSTWYGREFHTAPQKAGVAQNALEHFVNRNLFAGEWKTEDGSTVTFTADGKVSGWAKWTWFSVEIDKYGTEIQPDIMSAYNDKMGATYVYTLDNDRLSIYEYDSNSEDGMWTRGKLVIELNRAK